MKNIKKFLLMAVLVPGLFVLPLAYAENNGSAVSEHKAFCHKAGGEVCDIYSQLNLTDQQKKQLDENKNKSKEQNKTLFKQIKEKRESLRQELQEDKLDMVKINQANSELKKIEGRLLDFRLQGMLETKKILTPEQFKKLMAEKEEGMSSQMMGKHNWMTERGNKAKSGMTATQDGGVIVMEGSRLYKYDKDLNLIKEVKLNKKEVLENKDTVEGAEPQETQEGAGK